MLKNTSRYLFDIINAKKIYLSIVKKRDHFVFVILISISFSFLLNNDSTNTLLIRAKFLDSFSFITKPSMWIKSVSQLEEETQLLREKNLQLTLQSDAMIDAYNENMLLRQLLDYKKDSNFKPYQLRLQIWVQPQIYLQSR